MTREELLEKICYTDYTNDCSACDGQYNCQDCKDAINSLLDEYDKQIRADAIDEFINAITESRYARIWCCVDSQMESCSAKECAECLKHFKDILLEIAEKLKEKK